MTPKQFISAYQIALGTQKWSTVAPLISENACVTFSDGSVHIGKAQIQLAFERNFAIIKNEKYIIDQVKWLKKETENAVYLFEFNWTGIINGKMASGSGIGTSVIIKVGETWQLLTEHLGKR